MQTMPIVPIQAQAATNAGTQAQAANATGQEAAGAAATSFADQYAQRIATSASKTAPVAREIAAAGPGNPPTGTKEAENSLDAMLQPLLTGGTLDAVKLAASSKQQTLTATHTAPATSEADAKSARAKNAGKTAAGTDGTATSADPVSATGAGGQPAVAIPPVEVAINVPTTVTNSPVTARPAESTAAVGAPRTTAVKTSVTSKPDSGAGPAVDPLAAANTDTASALPFSIAALSATSQPDAVAAPTAGSHAIGISMLPVGANLGVSASMPAAPAGTPSTSAVTGPSAQPSTSVSAADTSAPATLIATPNVLEVGVANETHGWLRVRAEMNDSGSVSASVSTASTGAFEALHKELPAMSAYLANEAVGVSNLVVDHARPASLPLESTAAWTSDGASASGQGTGGSGQAASNANDRTATDDVTDWGVTSIAGLGLRLGGPEATLAYAPRSGGWLNVMA